MTEKQISEEDVIEASTAYMFTRGSEHTKMRAAIELLIARGWRRREDVLNDAIDVVTAHDYPGDIDLAVLVGKIRSLKDTP